MRVYTVRFNRSKCVRGRHMKVDSTKRMDLTEDTVFWRESDVFIILICLYHSPIVVTAAVVTDRFVLFSFRLIREQKVVNFCA